RVSAPARGAAGRPRALAASTRLQEFAFRRAARAHCCPRSNAAAWRHAARIWPRSAGVARARAAQNSAFDQQSSESRRHRGVRLGAGRERAADFDAATRLSLLVSREADASIRAPHGILLRPSGISWPTPRTLPSHWKAR